MSLPSGNKAAVRILACVGEFAYGRPERGAGVEISTLVPALRRLGHEVEIFDSAIRNRYADYAELNQALFISAEQFNPDVIITVIGDVEIWSETIQSLRSQLPNTVFISWTTDDTWKYRKVSRFIGCSYHGMTTTYADRVQCYHQDGIKQVLVTQWAANESWLRPPLLASACHYQISFVGIAYGDRRKIVDALTQRGIDVACFGFQWSAGPIPAEQIPDIMQKSVISLNFSKGLYGGPNQIKARTFEVPGAGGFLLTEHAPGLENWYDVEKEIGVWKTIDDLERLIKYYLTHPQERDVMAIRAHERTIKEHRYDHRMAQVISWAQALPRSSVTRIDFQSAVRVHQSRRWMSVVRATIEKGLSLFLGKDRARRYLRRVAFEMAWRIHRSSAFSARCWFGCAFPPMD